MEKLTQVKSIKHLFTYHTLKWIFSDDRPILMVDGRICPFLHIVWNESTTKEATKNLDLIEDTPETHALIVFLAHFILMLSNFHSKARKK